MAKVAETKDRVWRQKPEIARLIGMIHGMQDTRPARYLMEALDIKSPTIKGMTEAEVVALGAALEGNLLATRGR